MLNLQRFLAGLALALVLPAPLHAADAFTIRGFGTFALVHNSSDQADFIRDISQPSGARDGWSADVDSRVGLQLGYGLTSQLDGMVQVVSRYTPEGDYDPQLTWAFLRSNPNPSVQLRVGRIGLDTYMLADSRDVGYAYPWVRPPVDYYSTLHFSHIDGADLVLRRPLGNGLLWGKLFGGRADERLAADGGMVFDAEGSKVYGAHLNYDIGAWQARVGGGLIRYRLGPPQAYVVLIEQISGAYGPEAGAALQEALGPHDLRLYTAGVAFNDGRLQAQAMVNWLGGSSDAFETRAAYVSAGYRIGRFTPHVGLSAMRTELVDVAFLADASSDLRRRTATAGVRYDVAKNVALKTQVDRRDHASDWSGYATVFSLGLDFVF